MTAPARSTRLPRELAPNRLAETLARVPQASGLLPPHTLGVGRLQGEPFAVQYVPPRVVTLRMERAHYRIPLPPLIVGGWQTDYRIFAYAGDGPPTSDRAPLAIGPFPNLYADGRICWGSSDPRPTATPQTLLNWVRQHERDTGQREGVTTAEAARVKELEREVRELRKANEILKLASAFFAQAELDRRLKS